MYVNMQITKTRSSGPRQSLPPAMVGSPHELVGGRREGESTKHLSLIPLRPPSALSHCHLPRATLVYGQILSLARAESGGIYYLAWCEGEHVPWAIFPALKSGVKLEFHRTLQPSKTMPLLVAYKYMAFDVANLDKGNSFWAYQAPSPEFQGLSQPHSLPHTTREWQAASST